MIYSKNKKQKLAGEREFRFYCEQPVTTHTEEDPDGAAGQTRLATAWSAGHTVIASAFFISTDQRFQNN